MVLLVHFSFIHQTVIESASPLGYSSEHKRQRFLFFWRLHWMSFFPPTNTLQWFPGAHGKVQTPLYGGTALSGPGFLWGLGSHLACYHPTTPGRWFPYIPLQGDSSSPWRRAPHNPILLLSVTPTHTLRFKNHVWPKVRPEETFDLNRPICIKEMN